MLIVNSLKSNINSFIIKCLFKFFLTFEGSNNEYFYD